MPQVMLPVPPKMAKMSGKVSMLVPNSKSNYKPVRPLSVPKKMKKKDKLYHY